jgi:acetylornithine deacetylase/succinyl-diaminopimelate desuccinylase-like protein
MAPTRIEGRKVIPHNVVNVGVVRSGEKTNIIPSEAVLELDGHLLPGFGPEDMIAEAFRHAADPPEPATSVFGLLSEILRDADRGSDAHSLARTEHD